MRHLRPSFAQLYSNARNPYLSVAWKKLNSYNQDIFHKLPCISTSPIESVDFYNVFLGLEIGIFLIVKSISIYLVGNK